VRSDPRDVAVIVELARATYRKMVQNLWWATGYNAVAIPLAAGVLARAGILLSPALGAVLMSASTVVVALNAPPLAPGRRAPTGGTAAATWIDVPIVPQVAWRAAAPGPSSALISYLTPPLAPPPQA